MSVTITTNIGNKINEIPVYKFENVDDFLDRVASVYNTLRMYLFFPYQVNNINDIINTDGVVNIVDLIHEAKEKPDFNVLYNTFKDYVDKGQIKVLDLLLLSIINNTTIPPEFFKIMLEEYISTNGLEEISITDVNDMVDNRENEILNLNRLVSDNQNKVVKNDKEMSSFYDYTIGYETTEFVYENVTLKAFFNPDNMSIMEFFNDIKTNIFVPIANIDKLNSGGGNSTFFKISKDTLPYEKWSETNTNNITLQVLEKQIPLKLEEEDYSPTYLSVINDNKATFDMNISLNKISREEYFSRLQSVFLTRFVIEEINELNIIGTYNIINQNFNKHVFSELIMNTIMNKFAVVNESKAATKTKNSIFVYFDIPNIGQARVNFTPQYISRKNVIKGYDVGTPYVRIRVKEIQNQDKLDLLLVFIEKMFNLYNNMYDGIVGFYKKFIPNFGKEIDIKFDTNEKITLKNTAPELFVSGYSGQCAKNKNPTIISDEEMKTAEEEGYQVMVYPKLEDNSGKSRNYVCQDEKYKYPGLQKNNLSNKNTFQYLPCCFSKDQTTTPGTNYRTYYFDEVVEKPDLTKRYILQSNKTVNSGEIATLPENINDIFTIWTRNQKNIEFLRKGVRKSPSSFIDCVLNALAYESPNNIKQLRDSLANSQIIGACKQEMYDYTNLEIVNILKSNVYLDPKLFIHLLEEQFKCNIILFSSVNNSAGEMITPRFTEGYYQNYNKHPYVFIYENIGSKTENLTYPQCEIILAYNKSILTGRNIQENFKHDNPIVSKAKNMFSLLTKAYTLNNVIKTTEIVYPNLEVNYQLIDVNGKCRLLNYRFKTFNVSIHTEPIQPISAESVIGWVDEEKIPLNIAFEFANYTGIVITNQSIDRAGNVIFLNGKWSDVNIQISVSPEPKYNSLETVLDISVFKDNVVSTYKTFIENQKKSRYITDYFVWLYSSFIKENELATNLDSITSFVQTKITVKPLFVYGKISKFFLVDNPALFQEGKLILNSNELLKRLIYYLKYLLVREKQLVINYHQNTMIPNYYLNVTDFTKYQSQVILEGKDSINKFLLFNKDKKKLTNKIDIENTNPYFIKNNLIDNNILLAQNSNSLNTAIDLGSTWNTDGYNDYHNKTTPIEKPSKVTLYSYKNKSNITGYDLNIGDGETKSDEPNIVRVAGYKTDGISKFTTFYNISN